MVRPHFNKASVIKMAQHIVEKPISETLKVYGITETKDWKIEDQRTYFKDIDQNKIFPTSYRPFDLRFSYYEYNTINKIIPRGDSRRSLMRHMTTGRNIGLCMNCLLYTSPSPRDKRQSRMPSSA